MVELVEDALEFVELRRVFRPFVLKSCDHLGRTLDVVEDQGRAVLGLEVQRRRQRVDAVVEGGHVRCLLVEQCLHAVGNGRERRFGRGISGSLGQVFKAPASARRMLVM